MKRVVVFVAVLLSAEFLQAQHLFTFIKTDWDSAYYTKFATHWSARSYVVSKNQSFILTNRVNNDKIIYDPNAKAALGLGVSYDNYALDLGIAVSNKKEDEIYPTKSVDILSGLYTGQHVFDFSFQWYAGFFSTAPGIAADTAAQTFRSDIRTFEVGIEYNYNFNYRRFSFNAPFIGTQIQKKSAGAPLAGVFITYYDLRSNTNIIPPDAQNDFNDAAQLSEANLLTSGILGGYAYTFVLPKRFTLTASLTPGISFNIGDVKTQDYYSFGHPFTVSPKVVAKLAAGYGGKKFYSLLSYFYDGNYVNLGNKNEFNYNMSKLKFLVGLRIK
ncbi:MAG: DUF4421 family protein [Chitinophagales bacterium]